MSDAHSAPAARTTDDTAVREAKVFEYNAKEGARAVVLLWFVRKIAGPVLVCLALIPVAAFALNGIWAGLISLAVFSIPFLLLLAAVTGQIDKVLEYWRQ